MSSGEKESPAQEGMTFGQLADEWKTTCVLGAGLTESQIESDVSILKNHLLPFFGPLPLATINPRHVDRYKANKRTQHHQYGVGYAAKSINNHLSVLHRIFDKAIEYDLLKRNPVTKGAWMKRERTCEDSLNWWTPEEERKAVATLDSWKKRQPDRRLIILVQVMTGMRFSEIRSLERRDVDLKTPGLWVRRAQARKKVGTPKNKQARFQVIPKALAEELEAWLDKTDGIGDLLFVGTKGGPLANNSLNRWYRKLAREAEIRPISSHGARHTSGSTYATMGVGQKMIAKLLGHVTTKATERYTHIQVSETQPAVEARWARVVR